MTIVLPPGSWWRSAGWRYSSGSLHAAVDMACDIGQPVRAPIDGIVAEVSDGKHNNRPGESIWSGKPSNWVLLYVTWEKQKITMYFQHLSPGVLVRKGQRVKAGTVLGYSGNSGNSSGPHLHLHAYKGWQTHNRYANLSAGGSYAVYDPLKIKGGSDMALTKKEMQQIADLTAKKILSSTVEDGAFDKNSKYRKVSFKNLLSRLGNRTHHANQNAKRAAENTAK